MGIFDFLQSEPNIIPKPRFRFSDGSEMAPKELGAFFATSTNQNIAVVLDGLFGKGKVGQLLPLGRPILDDPMPAHLFVASMQIGALFSYPMRILKVPDPVIGDIFSGICDELLKLRKPDGTSLNPGDVIEVNNLIGAFNEFFQEDLVNKAPIDTSSAKAEPPKVTRLFLSLIVTRYNDGGEKGEAAVKLLDSQGYYHPSYAATTRMIDELPAVPLMGLHKSKVMFIPE